MKRKNKNPKPPTVAPSASPVAEVKPNRRAWLLVGLVAGSAVLGTSAVLVWRKHAFFVEMQAGLPALPDLAGKPAVFGELLAKAEANARSSSTMTEGVVDLGRLYHANNLYREAEACWQLLRTVQPREARWCYYLADLKRSASDYPGMTGFLEETLRLAPEYSAARLQLANLQFKTGELDQAERNYQLRLDQLPRDPYARLGLVRLALHKGRRDEAKTQLELLLQDNADFSSAHNLYAEILAATGDTAGASKQRWLGRETKRYREAEDPWLDELQAWCYDYDRLCVLGTIEYQTEHGEPAQAYFERAIKIKPDEPQAYELLGTLHVKRNEPAKARDTLEQALPRLGKTKPSPMFYINLSHAYRMLKQPADAVRVVRQGLEQVGDAFELLDALGVALADSGNHEQAVEAWHAALARNPNDANANYNLARSLLALRRLDDALAALDRSLTLQPTFPQTLLLRGRIELDSDHLELAERYLRPLYESHPEMLEARQLLANWHLRSGTVAQGKNNLPAAEQHYRDGLAIDRNNAELAASLGVLCLVHARFAEAVGPLESYHRLQPENAQSCLFLGQAYAAVGRRDDARKILTEGAQIAERAGNATTAKYCREMLQQF